MLTIGLTGGIASGKTTVADGFARRGIAWVDVDHIAREVVVPGEPAFEAIRERFGDSVIDAERGLDRRALRAIVFADPEQRRWLESVTHPRIRERLLERLAAMPGPYRLLVSPLLFETGQQALVDRSLVVDVPEALQIERTARRDGVDVAQAAAIVKAQMPRAERLARADDVIANDGTPDQIEARIDELDRFYRRLAAERT